MHRACRKLRRSRQARIEQTADVCRSFALADIHALTHYFIKKARLGNRLRTVAVNIVVRAVGRYCHKGYIAIVSLGKRRAEIEQSRTRSAYYRYGLSCFNSHAEGNKRSHTLIYYIVQHIFVTPA